MIKTLSVAGCLALTAMYAAHSQTIDTAGLTALQNAVREMCVQPDRRGNYLRVEGDLSAGATLRVAGVNGQGRVTREDWEGINQRIDQYKTDPRECAINLTGVLLPILTRPYNCDGRQITGYRRTVEVERRSPEMTGGNTRDGWCTTLNNQLRAEHGPTARLTKISDGESSRSTCAPFNCPAYTYSCKIRVEADPICN